MAAAPIENQARALLARRCRSETAGDGQAAPSCPATPPRQPRQESAARERRGPVPLGPGSAQPRIRARACRQAVAGSWRQIVLQSRRSSLRALWIRQYIVAMVQPSTSAAFRRLEAVNRGPHDGGSQFRREFRQCPRGTWPPIPIPSRSILASGDVPVVSNFVQASVVLHRDLARRFLMAVGRVQGHPNTTRCRIASPRESCPAAGTPAKRFPGSRPRPPRAPARFERPAN